MRTFENLSELPQVPTAIATIGFFDGFHLAHRKIIQFLVSRAKGSRLKTVVFTFKNHPLNVLFPERAPLLISPPEFKREFLESCGIDYLIMPEFTLEFSKIKAFRFLEMLASKFGHLTLVVGGNFQFGHRNEGSLSTLEDYSQKDHNFSYYRMELLSDSGNKVSSSWIRELISKGSMKEVARYLKRDFFVENTVLHGNELGRTIGFPTANIEVPSWQIRPKEGVYSGKVVADGIGYSALIYISRKKLNQELKSPLIESHLLDYSGTLYGKKVRVYFGEFIREPIIFDRVDLLKQQLEEDKKKIFS